MRTLAFMILLTCLMPGIATADDNRTVSVDGYAEIATPPDKATLRMGVEIRADTVQAARDKVADTVARFLKLTRSLGISDEQISTAAAIVRPDYDWNPQTRERRLLGYTVTRQLVVDLTELEQLGQLTESALELGINQVNPPELDTSRRTELQREALAAAARDARERARALAEALDARLGEVRTLQAAASFRPPMPLARGMLAAEADSGAETYQTGEITVTASVTASFDLVIH